MRWMSGEAAVPGVGREGRSKNLEGRSRKSKDKRGTLGAQTLTDGTRPVSTRSTATPTSTATAADGSVRATGSLDFARDYGCGLGRPQNAVTYKRLGERAEAAFLAKAAGLGFGVAKPWGDSDRYDFILDSSQILREERSGWFDKLTISPRDSDAAQTAQFQQEAPASEERSLTPPDRLKLWRVQVKSAHRVGADGGYSLRLFGHSVGAYREDEIDVLICYLAPEDAWYVFPPEVFRGRRSVKLFGGSRRRRSKFEKYREAWWVLSTSAAKAAVLGK